MRTDLIVGSMLLSAALAAPAGAATRVATYAGTVESAGVDRAGKTIASTFVDDTIHQETSEDDRQDTTASLSVEDDSPPPRPAPEPTTWSLILVGFGAVGAAVLSRRSTLTGSAFNDSEGSP